MAKYSNQVIYDIKTTLDASGITKLRSELNKLNQEVTTVGKTQWGLKDSEIQRTVAQVNRLQNAITECFNPKIGLLDLSKFNKTLEQEKALLGTINTDWAKMGAQGTRAINSLASSVLTLNKDAITMNSTLSKIANTFGNTVRWGITASIFQEMMSSVQGAVSYMKDLDESLTQIQMVTNSSKEDMRELAQYANNAAQALGSTTTDYTNAVKVFVQEGFSESESKQYANLSTKLANVSEQNTAVTSDQITAYRNAFQLDYEQTVEAMDKVANVANNTASNVNELMTASQRSASVANAVNASQDSFLASIATIESVTRQSAEEIGNGLKTIYQRMADIKVSGKTDDGVDYGQYAATLKEVGVDILDANREIKSFDQILTELQAVWGDLSDTMKQAVGQKVAGKFQYNRFVALMDNPEYYQKAYDATQGASGMMDQMNEYYMEGIEGRMKTLQAAGEQIMSTLFNQDDIEPIIEAATNFLNIINDIIDSVGGGLPVFTALSGILLRTFNSQIAEQAARIATNLQTSAQISKNSKLVDDSLAKLQAAKGDESGNEAIGKIRETLQGQGFNNLSENSREKLTESAKTLLAAETKIAEVKERQKILQNNILDEIQNQIGAAEELLAADKKIADEKQKIYEDDAKAYEKMVAENNTILAGEKEGSLHSEEELNEWKEELDISKKEADIARKKYEDTQASINLEGEFNAKSLEQVQTLDSINDRLGDRTNHAQEYLNLIEAQTQAEGEYKAAQEQLEAEGENAKTERMAASITNLVAGLTSAITLATSLYSVWQLWNNEDASFEEKVIGTLSSLTIILPLVITSYQALTAVKLADVTASATSVAIAGKDIIIKGLQAIANNALAQSLGAATVAQWALNVAMDANPIGLVIAAIAALIAIIGGVIALYTNWQDRIHAASKEFEAQQEILNKTKKNYTDLRDSVESLKQSIDSIGESKESLNDLTRGTDEWREAVRKLNDEVLTLIQTYPELAQYVNNDDGVLNISQENLDKFYSDRLAETRHLQDINTVQQINTLDAQNNKSIEDFSNQWGISKEEVRSALENEMTFLTDQSAQVNSAFSELTKTVQSNNYAIDNFKNSIGTLTDYIDYSTTNTEVSSEKINTTRNQIALEYGGRDLSRVVNNQEFINAVAEATGESIISAKDVSPINGDVELKLQNGETIKYTTDELLAILADSKIAAEIEEQILNDNIKVYEEFGAKYDSSSHEFLDASGNVITSLKDLAGVTEEQSRIMSKFADDENYKNFMSAMYGGVDEFTKEIASGDYAKNSKFADYEAGIQAFSDTEAFEAFKESKLIARSPEAQSIREEYNNFETLEDFTRAVKDNVIQLDGLAEAVKKLTPNMVDLTTNINGNEFTNRIDISSDEEKFKDFLEDSDMSEGAFNRMSRNSYEEESGYYQTEKERLEDLIAAKKEDGKVTEEETEEISKMNLEIEDLDDAAKDTTAAILRMSNGVVKLRNKIGDISEILTNDALEGTTEWYQALDDLDKGLSEVLNIDAGTLSDTFIESGDALEYAQRMAEGDMSAIDDLRRAASKDIIQNLSIQSKEGEDVDTVRTQLLNELDQLQAEISAGTITVTTDLDDKPFIQRLDEMLAKGQISAEQASNILSSIGMDAKIEHKKGTGYVQQISYHPRFTSDAVEIGEGGPRFPGIEMVPEMTSVETEIDIPYLVGAHYTGSGVQTANAAASNPSYTGGYSKNPTPKSSSGSSPKNSSSKQPKNNKPKDNAKNEWDYLTDITNDLDRQAAIIERLSKLEDGLYGKSRVSQLKKLQAEHKKNIKLLQQEVKLAQRHAKRLRSRDTDENGNLTINAYAHRAGFSQIQFDSKGNLENGKAIEAALTQKVNNAIADYNIHRNDEDTSYYEEQVRLAQEDHDGFMKALSEYESTLGVVEKGRLQIREEKEEIQDAADAIVDSIQEGIESVVKAIDNQRDFNKMYRDWMQGGSGYSHFGNNRQYYAEGLQGLLSPSIGKKSVLNAQLQDLNARTSDAADVFDIVNIKTGKRKGDGIKADDEKLKREAAQENLQQSIESVLSTLHSMIEYYDGLIENLEEVSAKMDELIEDRLQAYDNIESYLDSRLDQLKLLFGEDYGSQVQFYDKKIENGLNKMADIATAIDAKQATVKDLKSIEATNKELSAEQRKVLQDTEKEITNLQQEQIKTETRLLEDINAKLVSQTTGEMKKAINNMFGGNDVEWIAQQWEVATRNSEQYLDDYNRAFELQKLQLKYQDMLSDTQETNIKIQQRISSQMEQQLEYLRNKSDLSKYDVQYAEKQLEILQKQIALEEARDNKSQMQLQRNAAGNYDFVYGADEEAVNQATQALLNAQQEAYNLSKQIYLETYNSAVQAALQTKDMVVQIATDASLSLSEKTERIKYIMDNLNTYMQNSSIELGEISINLYNDFIEADRMVAEENLGKLQEVYGQIRDLSASATAAMKSDLIDYQNSEDGVNASWESIKNTMATSLSEMENSSDTSWNTMKEKIGTHLSDIGVNASALFTGEEDEKSLPNLFKTMTGLSNAAWAEMSDYIISDENGLPKIKQGAIDIFDKEKEGGIPKLIDTALTSIDARFVTTKDNSIVKISEIDSAVKTATENIIDIYLPNWESAIRTTLESADQDYDTFTKDSLEPANEAMDTLKNTTDDFKDSLEFLKGEITLTAAEINSWKGKMDAAFNSAGLLISNATTLAGWIAADGAMADGAIDNFDDLKSAADSVGSSIATMGDNASNAYWGIQSAASAAAEAYRDLTGAAQGAEQAAYAATNAINSIPQPPPNVSIDTGFSSSIGGSFGPVEHVINEVNKKIREYGIDFKTSGGGKFDTGGYTGTWSDKGIDNKNGKFAILHQKELVLNENDTKNMLSAVEVVRDIMSNINKLPSLGNDIRSNASNSNIEQRVEISASFPGVTTALEIERALTELADNAYQYANRYKY